MLYGVSQKSLNPKFKGKYYVTVTGNSNLSCAVAALVSSYLSKLGRW